MALAADRQVVENVFVHEGYVGITQADSAIGVSERKQRERLRLIILCINYVDYDFVIILEELRK